MRAITCGSASSGVLATRIRGFKSIGDFPDFIYFGGNSEMRGYDYLQFAGQNVVFANAELRFPLIEAALTPIGVIGGIRGVFFADIGGGWFNNQPSVGNPCTGSQRPYKFTSNESTLPAGVGVQARRAGCRSSTEQPAVPPDLRSAAATVSGFRLQDGARVVRPGPRNLRARLPDSLRLVVADALQQGLGRSGVRLHEREHHYRPVHQRRGRLPQAALRGVDWLRFLMAVAGC